MSSRSVFLDIKDLIPDIGAMTDYRQPLNTAQTLKTVTAQLVKTGLLHQSPMVMQPPY